MTQLLSANDMAKIGCHDCRGCSDCCRDMGQSIILDPYDIYMINRNAQMLPEYLLSVGKAELHVEDGLILPNLKMDPDTGTCGFLNEEGRCSIHSFRPGLCRLFPLGRNYTEGHLDYFVLEDACPAKNKTKLKISKWLEVEQLPEYQKFLERWHELRKRTSAYVKSLVDNEDAVKKCNLLFLQYFYLREYDERDFFEQFSDRADNMDEILRESGF